MYLEACESAHTQTTIIKGKRSHEFEREQKAYMKASGGRKGNEGMIIVLKS